MTWTVLSNLKNSVTPQFPAGIWTETSVEGQGKRRRREEEGVCFTWLEFLASVTRSCSVNTNIALKWKWPSPWNLCWGFTCLMVSWSSAWNCSLLQPVPTCCCWTGWEESNLRRGGAGKVLSPFFTPGWEAEQQFEIILLLPFISPECWY